MLDGVQDAMGIDVYVQRYLQTLRINTKNEHIIRQPARQCTVSWSQTPICLSERTVSRGPATWSTRSEDNPTEIKYRICDYKKPSEQSAPPT